MNIITPKLANRQRFLNSLNQVDKPAYLIVGLAAGRSEVLVKLSIVGGPPDAGEENLAHTRREQAATCFPQYDEIRLYLRDPGGNLTDITNE